MFVSNLHAVFHLPNSNDSLVTAIEVKPKYTFRAAAKLFCIM